MDSCAPYPAGLESFLYNWQTLITGSIAIIAAWLAYRGSLKQVEAARDQIEASRDLEQKKADDRKQAFPGLAALESQRLGLGLRP